MKPLFVISDDVPLISFACKDTSNMILSKRRHLTRFINIFHNTVKLCIQKNRGFRQFIPVADQYISLIDPNSIVCNKRIISYEIWQKDIIMHISQFINKQQFPHITIFVMS